MVTDLNFLWINDGSGNFTKTSVLADTSIQSQNVKAVDVDNDGDIDLYVCNTNTSSDNFFLINDGSGNFTKVSEAVDTGNTQDAAFADLDNDGDMDLITIN